MLNELTKINGPGAYIKPKLNHRGVDYFKCYINYDFKPKLFKLGLSNNSNIYNYKNIINIELLDYGEHFERYFLLRDIKKNVNLAFIMFPKNKKVGNINYNSIFEVTGQGLILYNREFYVDFIQKMGFTIFKFSRIDICMDLEYITPDYIVRRILYDYIEKRNYEPFIKKGKVETLYIGDRNKIKNTYQVIRIYDKILDTMKKNKMGLYNFDKIDDLTRLEIELRRDKAGLITLEKFLDDSYIFAILQKTFFKMNPNFFNFINLKDFEKINKKEKKLKKVDLDFFSLNKKRKDNIQKRNELFEKFGNYFINETEMLKSLKILLNNAKKLIISGYSLNDLILFLIQNDINEAEELKVKSRIKRLRTYRRKVKRIKQEHIYSKNNIDITQNIINYNIILNNILRNTKKNL